MPQTFIVYDTQTQKNSYHRNSTLKRGHHHHHHHHIERGEFFSHTIHHVTNVVKIAHVIHVTCVNQEYKKTIYTQVPSEKTKNLNVGV